MNVLRMWIGAAVLTSLLSLPVAAGTAVAAPLVDPPRPLPSGAELPVRPGDRVSVSVGTQDAAGSGDRVFSGAFAADGRLRMQDPEVVAVMVISCTAAPDSYEVRIRSGGDLNPAEITRLWSTVRVAPADAAERAECARKVSELPPESEGERYSADVPWPASEWDVRTLRAGDRRTVKDGLEMGTDGDVTLSSPAFTRSVVMHGAKQVSATVRIRCDAQPGLYVVHWNEAGKPPKVWARFRVESAAPDCRDPAPPPQASGARRAVPWLVGAGAAVAAASAYAAVRRRRGVSR